MEMLRGCCPGELIYRSVSYDFDPELAESIGARRASTARAGWALWTTRAEVVELNEPSMFMMWHRLLFFAAILRVRALIGTAPRVVTFAIDNLDFIDAIATKIGLPRKFVSIALTPLTTFLARTYDRVAFGTSAAEENYRKCFPKLRSDVETFAYLAPRCLDCDLTRSRSRVVAFLGSFEKRKGAHLLPSVLGPLLGSDSLDQIYILGKGPLCDLQEAFAETSSKIFLMVDPSRPEIHDVLSRTKVLVVPSQPVPGWREQVGLPILEGLSHACHIVTTSETGLSSWLQGSGHAVLDAGDIDGMSGAVRSSLESGSNASVDSLPSEHGRVAADHWLTRS